MKWLFHIALGLAVAIATAVLVLVETNVVDPADVPVAARVAGAGVLALSAAADIWLGVRERRRQEQEADAHRGVRHFMNNVLLAIDREIQTEYYKIGINVFVVPRWYRRIPLGVRRRLPAWFRRLTARIGPTLQRYEKLRLSNFPDTSSIRWTRGKGVIGRCWQERRPVQIDSNTLYADYFDCSEAEWNNAQDVVRMELHYTEFQRISKKYGSVHAVPIFKGPKDEVVGCLVVDTPFGESVGWLHGTVPQILAQAATEIADCLS